MGKLREGYLFVDHRASPGFSPELAQRLGLDPSQVGEGKVMEAATLTCKHCGVVVVKNPDRVRARARCSKCDAYVCDNCAPLPCRPFAQVVDDVLDGKTPIPVLAKKE